VVPYLPERKKGTRRATVESTRKCTTLKTEQVLVAQRLVVYFWKRTRAEGGAEGYSIGEVEGMEGGKEGSDQMTAERQVRVSSTSTRPKPIDAPSTKTSTPLINSTSGRGRMVRYYATP
jgi:hypothetical protein